jgi:Rad3-related DNA helicase
MVSADHFAHELRAQLKKAAAQGATRVVITSQELYRLLGGYPGSTHGMPACCDAMRAEMKSGDILLVEQPNGTGMTIGYQLPRPP